MAYNAYNNFINPVRQPNSSIFPVMGSNNRVVNYGGGNQYINREPYLNKPQINNIRGTNQQTTLSVQPHHLPNYNIDNIPPNMINNNKRLELIQREKDNLYQTLKDNELLERDLLHKSEKAIKIQQQTEVDKVKSHINILRKELEEKETLEKILSENQIKSQIEKERRELDKIREHKNMILDKISSQETNIVKIREQDEMRRLEYEKDELSKKWKEMQLEEERKRNIELHEQESKIRSEQEKTNIESMEIDHLRKETEDLKKLLDHRSNQEEWLSKRIAREKEAADAAGRIRKLKQQQLLDLEEKTNNANKKKEEEENLDVPVSKTKGFRKRYITKNINHVNTSNVNDDDDGYQSDIDAFGDIDNIFNDHMFTKNIDPPPNDSIRSSGSKKGGVDPSDYDLDNIDNIDINFKSMDNVTTNTSNVTNSIINGKNKSISENSTINSLGKSSNNSHNSNNSNNSNTSQYDTIMNKLLQEIEAKKDKIKNKQKQNKLTVMLEAYKMMSNLCENTDDDNDELQDSLRKSNDPISNIEITKPHRGQPILPSTISDNSELDTEISDIHRQMSDIKGILKNT